jgi:hypothetical protein
MDVARDTLGFFQHLPIKVDLFTIVADVGQKVHQSQCSRG